MSRGQAHSRTLNLPSTLTLSFLLALLLVPLPLRGQQPGSGEEVNTWKYKHLAVVVHNSGAHRPTALYCIDVLNQLAGLKPLSVSVSLFGFEEEFQQLEGGRFSAKSACSCLIRPVPKPCARRPMSWYSVALSGV